MKLIRVSSDNDNALFETQFNQSINIKPMSKIALNNITANLKPVVFENNSASVIYTFETQAGSPIDDFVNNATILIGEYDRNNYGVLLDTITNDFNSKTGGEGYLTGSQYRAKVIDGRTNIDFRRAYNDRRFRGDFTKTSSTVSTEINPVRLLMDSPTGATTEYNNGFFGKYPVSNGNGYFRTLINKLVQDTSAPSGLDGQGFLIGLTEKVLPNTLPSDFQKTDVKYGVGVGWDGSAFKIYAMVDGVIDNVNVYDPTYVGEGNANNSVLEMTVFGDVIQFFRTDGTNYTEVIDQVDRDVTKPLYPFIVFHSNEDFTKAQNPELTYDPYIIKKDSNSKYPASQIQPALYYPDTITLVSHELDFDNSDLTKFLGYEFDDTTSDFGTGNVNFMGEFQFLPAFNTRNFILELLTFNVESYDSSQNQRRNIVSSVITSDENDVITNEPNIIYIDLLNKNELDIRNITLRLVDNEYRPIQLRGKSTLTLLVADQTDKSF